MLADELKRKYMEFFRNKSHAIIESSSLIPENDPTVLFTTAGMHPLVPFLLGQKHPLGKRLVDVQKCLRTDDIDEVGDPFHLTFFQMLGNWSLGDYFKKEAIEWSLEFLTKILGIPEKKISVSVFAGDNDALRDEESADIWLSVGIPEERIFYFSKKENWWGPAGKTWPCGPCTEMFYDTGKKKCSDKCDPSCSCGKYAEILNNVFMEYNKNESGAYEKLKQRNVDTGMGLERTLAVINEKDNVYETELFEPIIMEIRKISETVNTKSERIIADHLRAAVFVLAENIRPSNVEHGYILRRLIRRAIRHGHLLGIRENFTKNIAEIVMNIYSKDYKELEKNRNFILDELEKEENRFGEVIEKGLRHFSRLEPKDGRISGKEAFLLFQSAGLPIEVTKELATEKGWTVDVREFEEEYQKHQELSRKNMGSFKSGLHDHSEQSVKYHTATHLLHQALRAVLGDHVAQKGSNITPERLRFDFSHPKKMTEDEIRKVEDAVNDAIKASLPVKREEMPPDEAKKLGAIGLFGEKYNSRVSVYFIGNFSKEICTGPHVQNTKELGHFRIVKEEAVSAGVRRIKAILE